MKTEISQCLNLDIHRLENSSTLLPLCQNHYLKINHLMICKMCKRRLSKNHIHFVTQVRKLKVKTNNGYFRIMIISLFKC